MAGDPEYAAAYRDRLDLLGDHHLKIMAGLTEPPAIYGVAQGKTVHFVPELDETAFDENGEVETVIKFGAVAKRIASVLRSSG